MGAERDRSLLGAVTDFGVFRIRFSTLCLSLVFGFVLPYPPSFLPSAVPLDVQIQSPSPSQPTFSSRYNRKFLSPRTLISIYVYIILHSPPPHLNSASLGFFFPLQGGGGTCAPPSYICIYVHVFYPPEEEAGKLSTVSLVSRPETCFGLLAELGACLITPPPPL